MVGGWQFTRRLKVHCTANPTRLAHPSSLVRFVGILTRTRSRCCSKRQRTQVIWSGFIHVQKLQCTVPQGTSAFFPSVFGPCANHLLELFPIIPVVVGYRNTTIIGTREQRQTFHESIRHSQTKGGLPAALVESLRTSKNGAQPQMVFSDAPVHHWKSFLNRKTNNKVFSEIPMFPSCDFGQT